MLKRKGVRQPLGATKGLTASLQLKGLSNLSQHLTGITLDQSHCHCHCSDHWPACCAGNGCAQNLSETQNHHAWHINFFVHTPNFLNWCSLPKCAKNTSKQMFRTKTTKCCMYFHNLLYLATVFVPLLDSGVCFFYLPMPCYHSCQDLRCLISSS